ncbi:MAG: Ig-like domain-containing protein [Pseudomonadota bacterium]
MKPAVEMPSANVIEAVQVVGNKGSFGEGATGSHTKISVKAGEKFRLKKAGADSIADDVIALKEGDTLSLQYADGTQISLEGFYTSPGAEIELSLDNGASHTIASTDTGTTLSNGSSLVYSHGNTTTLMGMVSQNETLQTALANNTSLAHLDRYAQVATGVATDAVAGGAGAGTAATVETAGGLFAGMSTGAMVGLGALGVGVVAVAAGGGGGGSSAPSAPADTTAPVLTGVLAHGVSKTVVLTYGETLDASHPPLSTSFTITTGGVANVVTAVAVSGSTVTLTLTSAFSAGDAVVISYNGSGVNAIQDASGNDAVAIASLSSGAVADGYVRGAQIWIDTNHDGVQDYNTGLTTDESGNFFLPPGTPSGSIVAIGGVNIDTGVENTMPLRAPEGSTVINPLTTLVQAIIQANPSTSIADASTSVVTALGLTAGTNLTTYDPIEAAQSSDPTVAANALVAQQAAATVATIITLAAESAADSTAATTATNTIISNIVTQIQASETSTVVLDLGDSTTISNMTAGVTLSDEVQSAIADASTAIQAATVLSEITTAQSVALDTVAVSASTITATAITADTTPAIKINLTTTSTDGTAAISGDTVLLKADGVQIASSTLSELDIARGYITLNSPVLSEGVHAISAVIVDQAGNISAPYPSVNVTVDTTPTTPSTINRIATDDIINLVEKTAGVVLSGTIASGSTVTVEGNAATVTGTSWSYTLTAGDYTAMGEGTETIDVRVTAANATFADSTRNITIDTITPTAPTINAVSTDSAINTAEKNGTVTISGTAEANALITLTLGAGNIHAVTTNGSGAWTYTLTEADYTSIGSGTTITATAKDAAGNVSALVSQAITVDTGAPLLTVNSIATDNIINSAEKAATVTVTGVNEAGATVTVNGASATVTGTTWSYTLTSGDYTAMGEGSETLTIVTTDAAGNATTRTKTINIDTTIATPTAVLTTDSGTSATDDITNSAALTFSSKAADVTRTFTVDAGSASATYVAPTADGSHTVTVTDTDTAGNTATVAKTFTLDTTIATPTAVLTTDSGTSATDDITNSAALTFNTAAVDVTRSFVVDGGSASAIYVAPTTEGSHTVVVTDTDTAGNTATLTKTLMIDTIAPTFTSGTTTTVSENTTTAVYTAVATGDATYSLGGTDAALFNVDSVSGAVTFKVAPDYENPTDAGTNNTYDITVTATDTAGNTSNQAVAITVQNVDVTVNNVATDNIISAAEKATGVTLTGNNEPGISVVTVNGQNATVNGTSWSYALDTAAITAMGEGSEILTIVSGGTTITKDITVDTVAPIITMNPATADNILNALENSNPIKTITGTTTAQDGQVVTYKVDGIAKGTGIVSGGAWSVTFAAIAPFLSDGAHIRSAEVSDTAGNIAIVSSDFTVDAAAPTITISAITADDILNTAEVAAGGAISGTTTAEDGRIVTVKINGFDLGTATVSSGAWSFPVSASDLGTLTQGSYSITADVSDTAGNPAVQATHSFSVDSVAPTGTISNASFDNILNATENVAGSKTITGTSDAENGSTVVVKIDGNIKGTTTVTGGAWSLTYTTTGVLSDGTHTRSAEITDLAGNVGIVSKTFTADTVVSALGYTLSSGTATVSNLEVGATWEYQIDGGSFFAGTGNTFAISTVGSHTFSIRQTDSAGNVSTISNGVSADGGNPPPNYTPYTMINNNTLLIAKGQALNIDLQNYVSDPDGDTVTITVNSSTLPTGLSISNGIITGSTTATSGSLNVTLDDGHGGISTQTINLAAIDMPSSMAYVYGAAATIDSTTNFFGVDSYDLGIWSLSIGDVVSGSTTEGSFASYNYANGAYVADTNDAGNFDVVSTTATGVTLTHSGTTETVVFSDAKAVTSVDGVVTTGLNSVTATWTVTAQTNTVATATDWWTENYTYWDQSLNNGQGGQAPITTLTGLRDAFVSPNWGGDVYINENTRVNLVGTTGATSGTLISQVWDGTYNTYTDQNGLQQIDKHTVDGAAISGGTWAIETISGVEYLTVTVPNQGIHAFKVENGVLLSTEIAAAGTSYSETMFYGPSLVTFQGVVIDVIAANAPIIIGTPFDAVIISSTLAATETAITAFPVGTTFTDGYVTMVFSSATAGTITEPNGLVHNLTLANGIASASVEGITYSYKMLSGSGDMIILGQTDTDLTVEMNGETQGPPAIWTLISTTATVDPFPSSGIMTLWETSTDNFGDQYGTTWAKTVFDFTNNTAQDYFINGTADTVQTFTVDTTTNTMHIAATASNGRTSDIQLMGGFNGFYAFESHYTESYTWGQNSAGGSADMSAYLVAHSDILWSENGYDNNNNGTMYDYGMVTRTNGTVTGTTDYNSNLANHSDSTENWSSVSATLSNGNLVINEGDRTNTYSIANNEMNVTQAGTDVFSFTETNPFSYTYAYEMNMGNGTVGVGLHDAMALNVGDLNYNHTLYGIDSAQDTGVNAITITPADVLAQGVSDGLGHYGIGINKGDNDSVTLTGWTDTTQDVNISGIMYSIYTDNTQVAQLYISNSAPL